MALALFDLDNTLIAGDSDHAWGEFLVEQGLVDKQSYRRENDRFYQLYQQGKLNINDYLNFALAPLARIEKQNLLQLREQFIIKKIQPMRLQKADDLIRQHKQNGDLPVIITSTNRFVTEPIAQLLGIEHLLATELEKNDSASPHLFTGKIIGEACFREGKITHLKNWIEKNNYSLQGCWFYSDSINDLPLLEKANKPIAVDPDPTLQAHAQNLGWSILSLRDN